MRCSLPLLLLLSLSAIAIVAAGGGHGDGKCPSSHYTGADGACTECPENMWAPKGSDSIDDCSCWYGYEKQADGSCTKIEKIDGGWCPLSECSASCGCGVQTRVCECPAPSGGGAACKGKATVPCVSEACVNTEICPASTYSSTGSYTPGQSNCTACPEFSWSPAGSTSINDCSCWAGYEGANGGPCTPVTPSVNGGWCPVTECNATCDGGVQTRVCACPPRQGDGADCEGSATLACNTEPCVKQCREGYYSSTGTWDCRTSTRCRKCPKYSWSPAGSDSKKDCVCWDGYESVKGRCKPIKPVNVDGGWCPASECSVTCGTGTQTRECGCPAPQGTGANCTGEAVVECNKCACEAAPPTSKPCPTSTYSADGTYTPGQSECSACPEFTWSPSGSTSINDCSCWAGYEGANGGPCTEVVVNVNGGWCPLTDCDANCNGGKQTRTCACPAPSGNGAQCEGASEVACNTQACVDPQPGDVTCSAAVDEAQCNSWQGCEAVSGYDCRTGEWCTYLGCSETNTEASHVQTCAVHTEDGNRAWFPSSHLPAGYVATTPMGSVRSCCAPENCNTTRPAKGGCKYELGAACVVLQFRGECPVDVSGAVEWIKNLWKELADHVDVNQYAGLAQALVANYINVINGPSLNNGTNTFCTTIQIAPASPSLPYTPEQIVAWIQSLLASGDLADTNVASQLQGVAAYSQFTKDSVVVTVDNAANSFAQSSLMLVLATGVVGTIVAKLASFMQ